MITQLSGLILCSEKNEAIAKYSVLNERKQIFASKYMLYLPTEEELQIELQRERKLIETYIEHLHYNNDESKKILNEYPDVPLNDTMKQIDDKV